jgi:hypothetical protein
MSEPRRRVTSKGALRLTAWSSAAAAFLGSWGVLGTLPKPTAATAIPQSPPGEIVIVKKVLRRVIVHEAAPTAPPTVVTFDPGSSGSSTPPPPAPTSTGGS